MREHKRATIKYTGYKSPYAIHEISLDDLTMQTGMQSAHAKSEVPCFLKIQISAHSEIII